MPTLLYGLVGAFVGAAIGSLSGAVAGFAVGVLWAQFNALGARVRSLEQQLRNLEQRPAPAPARPRPPEPAPSRPPVAESAPVTPPPPLPTIPTRVSEPVTSDTLGAPPQSRAASSADRTPAAALGSASTGGTDTFHPAIRRVIEFFTTGNLVAKVGVVVLFFGVAFLLRFAAERGLFPIEYRLIGVTIGALGLLGLGWRLRHSRPDYATAIQGGAVGILYLTIFAAFRLYALVPASLTFALMLAVVVLSGALAVLQNERTLAVLGTSGGFLAPILASTGSGSHVTLFSYYLVLNAGIVGLAWFRAWRLLNWLGFVFTFGIGLFWGSQYYQPALFRSTEPFLVTFFLFYVTVAVLFAHRQPPNLRGYIDGSLVFGTPALAFTMQSVLVGDIPFGRAYSAIAVSAMYVLLARALWRREQAQRPLAEAFLALGVVFLTLAVPLAFDGHATAAAWALEGAGLVWVGVRQQRVLARIVGSLLLLGAGQAFMVMAGPTVGMLPILNSRFLGCVAIAASGMIAAYHYSKAKDLRLPWEKPIEWILLAWGLLWWSGGIAQELDRFLPGELFLTAFTVSLAATSVILAIVARRKEWRAPMHATLPLLPLLWLLVLVAYADPGEGGPWRGLGWLAWPASIAASYMLLWWFELIWWPGLVRAWHAGTAWLLLFLVTWTMAAVVRQLIPEAATWWIVMWPIVPSLAVLALLTYGDAVTWPVRRFDSFYVTVVPILPLGCVLLWVLWAVTESGEAAPLPYVPIANPIEIAQGLGLLTARVWWRRAQQSGTFAESIGPVGRVAFALLAFLVANTIVGRLVHFYLDVPFDVEALGGSAVFQAGISVLWALTALSLMTLARRRVDRTLWRVGASLLGVLILKLFVVDLGNVGGIARIVSFLVTGLLILVIGYFSPAPPKQEPTP